MDHEICDEGNLANRSTKKVRIRATEGVLDVIMDPIRATGKPLSWKDRLLGTRLRADVRTKTMNNFNGKDDFKLSETDIVRSSINGIPSIHFSEQVNKLLIKDMACTVVIKLLGRSIGYSALYNKHFLALSKHGHGLDSAPGNRGKGDAIGKSEQRPKPDSNMDEPVAKSSTYGPWMSVERKGWRLLKAVKGSDGEVMGTPSNSRYHALETLVVGDGDQEEHSGLKAKPGYKGNRPVAFAPTKEVDPSLIGPKQQKEGGGQLKLGSTKLVIEKEVGVSNVGFKHQWLAEDNPLVLGSGSHRPVEGKGPSGARGEGYEGVRLRKEEKVGEGLNRVPAKLRVLEISHLVQGGRYLKEERLTVDLSKSEAGNEKVPHAGGRPRSPTMLGIQADDGLFEGAQDGDASRSSSQPCPRSGFAGL
ncbi:hypothetical protein Gotur_028737 [Gossypium turneri]